LNEHRLQQQPPTKTSAAVLFAAAIVYAVVLLVFWVIAKRFAMEVRLGGHMASAFAAFALLLAPYWFFAFGLADLLHAVRGRIAQTIIPAVLLVPYVVYAVPRGEWRLSYALVFVIVPVLLAGMFAFAPPKDDGLSYQDLIALVIVGIPVEFGLLRGAFPHSGLAVFPKFLLMDALLYVYLVVRRLPGIGYDLRLRGRDFAIGLREWAFFAPIAILLGLAIHFIRFHAYWPEPGSVVSAWLITFFFVALPEEFFFRGLLQNLLENRLGSRPKALLIASVVFGLSHFNKPLPFNWRYVILATIAGAFYARAWLDRRRLACSAITHATVDVVWGLWFRIGP
jgi:membrane protease YdiL (CAAX protease family)